MSMALNKTKNYENHYFFENHLTTFNSFYHLNLKLQVFHGRRLLKDLVNFTKNSDKAHTDKFCNKSYKFKQFINLSI